MCGVDGKFADDEPLVRPERASQKMRQSLNMPATELQPCLRPCIMVQSPGKWDGFINL